MFEKHLWKSDILSKYAGHRQLVFTSKMFEKHLWKSDILLVKTDYLVYP